MKYIVLEKFTNSLVTTEEGDILEFDSEINAGIEAKECQNGLVIPIDTDRLFTKSQVLDILVSFDQSHNPECYETSKELMDMDFYDAAFSYAEFLNIAEDFSNYCKDKGKGDIV